MKSLRIIYSVLGTTALGASALISNPGSAFALTANDSIKANSLDQTLDSGGNVNGQTTIAALATTVINYAFFLAGIVAVLFLILFAFQYITAGGDAEKVKKARAGIINAVVGLIVLFAAFLIVRFAVGIGRGVAGTNLNNGGSSGGGTILGGG